MYHYNPEKIKEIRIVKGLSRESLAAGSGVTTTTIFNIERGNTPQLKSLIALVNFLNVSISDVIEFEPKPAGTEALVSAKDTV